MKLSAKSAEAVMSKKLSPCSAAVVRLKVHRREEDYRVVLQEEGFPEQNSMLTRRVGKYYGFLYGKGECNPGTARSASRYRLPCHVTDHK